MKRFQYQIKNLGNQTGEVRIRGVIGISNKDEEWVGMTFEGQGGTVKEFDTELRALGELTKLNLYISSEGGLVSDGLAIHNILKRHTAQKTCFVDGYAYSIASVITTACDEVRMPSNALLMIHNASSFTGGDYREFERQAEALKAHNKAIRNAYAAKSGRDEKEFIGLMDAETYLDGPAAKALGLVDVVTDDIALSNLVCSPAFRNSPQFTRQPARFAALFDTPPPPSPSRHITPMKPLIALASALGITLPDNCTEDQAITAFKAYKAPEKNVVIDFEDTAVKAAFTKAITDATKADKDLITALQTDLNSFKALLANGAIGAAGGNPPAPSVPGKKANTMARTAFNKLTHAERNAFMAAKGTLTDD